MLRTLGTFRSSSRFWMLFASLATRSAGFLASFLIARLAGPSALGTYSTLVNTAASATIPFTQVLGNNATISSAEALRGRDDNYRETAKANFVLALALSSLSVAALLLIYERLLGDPSDYALLATGVLLIVGQMFGAVSLGFLHGAARFVLASKISALASLAVLLGAYPAIKYYGLHGALVLVLFLSLFPALLMGASALRRGGSGHEGKRDFARALKEAVSRFLRALPSVAAIAYNSAVSWACTIYLVRSAFGTEGVGLVAVAGQWLTLMLIPATSWGGMSLKTLADAVASGTDKHAWQVSVGLIRKNLLVTLILAMGVASASGLIAEAYRLRDTDLVLLICIYGICAVVAAVYNILERFLLVLDRQSWWLCISLVSYTLQFAITSSLIGRGIWAVAAGVLVSGVVLCSLSYFGISRALQSRMKERK